MKTYAFKVIIEPDEDRWHASCPALVTQGAATWGYTEEEALKNIAEVVKIVIDSMIEHGDSIPTEAADGAFVFAEPLVAVTVQNAD